MGQHVSVIGDGGWGTTLAILLFKKGYDVALWGAFPEYVEKLKKDRINHKFLPGVRIPDGIDVISDAGNIPKETIVLIAIPSKYLRDTLRSFNGRLPAANAVSLTKGIEMGTLKRPSEIITEILAPEKLAVLSGPSITFEVVRDMPTTVVAASREKEFAAEVQDIFTTANLRTYVSGDMTGVELGGALKNVIAIAAGISDGMGFGVNTKAALLTRGLVEITRLGSAMGGAKETFFGLSGLGDLATTCISSHSRNRWFGEEIGKGRKMSEILKGTEMIVEGITTAKSAYELSKKMKVEMPITQKIYEVLYEEKEPEKAVRELMTRSPKPETI